MAIFEPEARQRLDRFGGGLWQKAANRFLPVLISLLTLTLPAAVKGEADLPTVLRFGRVSVEDPAITLIKYQPIIADLGVALERRIELVQTTSYQEMQQLFQNGQVHLGILNALSYARMGQEAGLTPVAKRMVGAEGSYRCYIVAGNHLQAKTLDDLRGTRFAFSEKDSTTGYLLPMLMFRHAQLDPQHDFSKVLTIVQHDSLLLAVANRSIDAAAVASYIFDTYDRRITDKLTIIDKSFPIPLGPLVVRKDLGESFAVTVREYFLGLDRNATGRSLLKEAGLSSFAPADDGEYDIIRQSLTTLIDEE